MKKGGVAKKFDRFGLIKVPKHKRPILEGVSIFDLIMPWKAQIQEAKQKELETQVKPKATKK